MNKCQVCATPVTASMKFCPECGQPIRHEPTCPKCGKPAAETDRFCGNCGTQITTAPTPPVRQATTPSPPADYVAQQPLPTQPESLQPPAQPPAQPPRPPSVFDYLQPADVETSKHDRPRWWWPETKMGLIIYLVVLALVAIIGIAHGIEIDDNDAPPVFVSLTYVIVMLVIMTFWRFVFITSGFLVRPPDGQSTANQETSENRVVQAGAPFQNTAGGQGVNWWGIVALIGGAAIVKAISDWFFR